MPIDKTREEIKKTRIAIGKIYTKFSVVLLPLYLITLFIIFVIPEVVLPAKNNSSVILNILDGFLFSILLGFISFILMLFAPLVLVSLFSIPHLFSPTQKPSFEKDYLRMYYFCTIYLIVTIPAIIGLVFLFFRAI